MISEINANQYAAAAQFSAAKTEAEKQKKASEKKTGALNGVKKHFSDLMTKPETNSVYDSEFPPEIQGKSFDDALSFLLDEVTMSAEEVKKSPFTDAFPKYRKKISQFMRFIVKNCYDIEGSSSRPTARNPHPKKKYIIKIVDDKLDQLARDILYNQADQLNLLAKVEEINGLLIDLIS